MVDMFHSIDQPFQFFKVEAIYFKAYWFDRSSSLKMAMSWTFGVQKFLSEKLLAKTKQKRQLILGEFAYCDQQQYLEHTKGASVNRIDAILTHLENPNSEKKFRTFSIEF